MAKWAVMVLVSLVVGAAPALAAEGWVVRICRGFTEASAIKISAGPKGGTASEVANWQSDSTQLEFPVKSDAKQLNVTADSEPADGKVAMCVLHGGKAVKAMNFNDLLEVTADQGAGSDSACKCPKSGDQ